MRLTLLKKMKAGLHYTEGLPNTLVEAAMKTTYRPETDSISHENRLRKIREQREKGHHLSRHNLWELCLFLVVSICAYNVRDLNLFTLASEPLRQLLGAPPPAYLVSLALAIYFGSSLVLGIGALVQRTRPTRTWNHLGYRSAFYFFYAFTGSIGGYFLPVLLSGLFLYGLDQCQLRLYNQVTFHGYSSMPKNL